VRHIVNGEEQYPLLQSATIRKVDPHPQTDEHLAACPSCMMAHDKALD